MLDISFGELIVIVLVALLIFKPSELPIVARKVGKCFALLKRMIVKCTDYMQQQLNS